MVHETIALVILAGGASRRFQGRQKTLIDLGGKTIIEILLDELAPVFSHVYICLKDANQLSIYQSNKISFPANSIITYDLNNFPGGSREDAAIFGLYSALSVVQTSHALVISGDMPFITRPVIDLLASNLSDIHDAIIPRWDNGYCEPTLAIYRVVDTRAVISQQLAVKQYSLFEISHKLSCVHYLPVNMIKSVDPDLACFFNINMEHDLTRAREIYQKKIGKKE